MDHKRFCAALFTVALVVGCNKGPSIATYPVTGKVTYNGKPVAGATVSYISANPDAPKAGGFTDSDGQFSLSTYTGPNKVHKGAPAGDYQVIVVKQPPAVASKTGGDMSQATPEQRAEMMTNKWQKQTARSESGAAPPPPKSEIPEKYAKADSSNLKATVVSGNNDPVEFKLTDD